MSRFRVVHVLIAGFYLLLSTLSSAKPLSPAIPRSKMALKGVRGKILGNGFMQSIFREIKSSFCSELEAVTLQLTRPTNTAIAMPVVKDLINFVDLEYDSPQLMISLLVKLSRKFAEHNAYTIVKALLALHLLMENVNDKARLGLLKSLQSLRAEVDEKTGKSFFSVNSVDLAADYAATVVEIETVELARAYSEYVFSYFSLKGKQPGKLAKKESRGITLSTSEANMLAENLMQLLTQGRKVELMCKRLDSPLTNQCRESIKLDQTWMIKELMKLYQGPIQDSFILADIKATILSVDSAAFFPTASKRGMPRLLLSSSSSSELGDISMLNTVTLPTSKTEGSPTRLPDVSTPTILRTTQGTSKQKLENFSQRLINQASTTAKTVELNLLSNSTKASSTSTKRPLNDKCAKLQHTTTTARTKKRKRKLPDTPATNRSNYKCNDGYIGRQDK